MAQRPDLRAAIDGYMAADKMLAGSGRWQIDFGDHCRRWTRATEVNGELTGIALEVKAYPRKDELEFRVLLNAARCIWRLDFADDGHVNPLTAPERGGIVINGPHYHSWSDNRRYAKPNSLPQKLHVARILPINIRSFDAAFRWFCAETKVFVETADIPVLPKRDTLI